MRLLLVEDSEILRSTLCEGLARLGWTLDAAADGVTALDFANTYPYDLVILDLMLPRLDGLGVLRRLREQGQTIRVLVLSARDQVDDRVQALNLGADDYLVKPFAFDELVSRVQALMRRRLDGAPPQLRRGELEVDPAARLARMHGETLPLTPKEYALLETLMRQRGEVISRTALFEQLYDSRSEASDKVIEVLLSTLRAKLAKAGQGDLIETRRGFGYLIP